MNEFMSPVCPLSKKKVVSSFGKSKEAKETHMSRIDEQFKMSGSKRLFNKESVLSNFKQNPNILNSQTTTTKVGGSNSKQSASCVFDSPTSPSAVGLQSQSVLGSNEFDPSGALMDITD